MISIRTIRLFILVFVLAPATNASAVTIVTTFVGGAPPADVGGAGNLPEIVNAASRMWESAYSDEFTVWLYFGWGPVGDAGTHTLIEQGGEPNREIVGIIYFDNSGAVSFYLDPTPDLNDEYRRRTDEYQDLGGGFVNVARVFGSAAGEAAGRTDLLSVALHEIGHAMGLSTANLSFAGARDSGLIAIGPNHPYAGTVVPLARNNFGFTSHFDSYYVIYGSVMAGICGGERRLPSALDILANAELSGFTVLRLDLQPTPEPVISTIPGNGRIFRGEQTQRKER